MENRVMVSYEVRACVFCRYQEYFQETGVTPRHFCRKTFLTINDPFKKVIPKWCPYRPENSNNG